MSLTVTSIKRDKCCNTAFYVTVEQRLGHEKHATVLRLNSHGGYAGVELLNRNPIISVNSIGEVKLSDIEIDIIRTAMKKIQQFQED
jgi:hypothetical protein